MDPALIILLADNLRRIANDLQRYAQTRQPPAPSSNGHPPDPAPALLAEPGPPDTKLMKIAEVTRELQLSPAKVYQMIACGELPSVTFGKSRRVVRADLEAWLAKGGPS